MSKIPAIIRKDFLLRFASRSELLFFIILPVVFTFLLSGGTPSGEQDNRIRLAVVDEAQTTLSQQLIAELEKSASIRPDVMDASAAQRQFNERRVVALLHLPKDLDLDVVMNSPTSLALDQQPNNINALIVEQAVRNAIQKTSSTVSIAQAAVLVAEKLTLFETQAARQAYYEAAYKLAQDEMDSAPTRLVARRASTADNVEYDPAANSSAGQLITWVFIPLIGISAMFAYERNRGTLRRLLTTPTSNATYLMGTILGQVLMAVVQMLLLVGFGVLVMKLNWGQEPVALAVVLVSSALAAAALGTMLGTFVKTEGQASGLSIMLGMVMALLGGCWYPIELFPETVQTAVKVLPTTWAMQGLLDLVLRGQDLAGVIPEAGVLLGFAVLFLAVGIFRYRFE